MELISQISQVQVLQQSHDNVSLTIRSGPPLPDGMAQQLTVLLAETHAAYPNQTLPEGTPDMYLAQWEEIALRFKMKVFVAGLSRAIRENKFFPDPHEIRKHCS